MYASTNNTDLTWIVFISILNILCRRKFERKVSRLLTNIAGLGTKSMIRQSIIFCFVIANILVGTVNPYNIRVIWMIDTRSIMLYQLFVFIFYPRSQVFVDENLLFNNLFIIQWMIWQYTSLRESFPSLCVDTKCYSCSFIYC